MVGQVKSVKTVLKQLQQSIQTITSAGWPTDEEVLAASNAFDAFQWLSKDHLCILVYLVTVMHSMQAGYMDKAQKYTDKALHQIDKLKRMFFFFYELMPYVTYVSTKFTVECFSIFMN